jgi:hypothetical protein
MVGLEASLADSSCPGVHYTPEGFELEKSVSLPRAEKLIYTYR